MKFGINFGFPDVAKINHDFAPSSYFLGERKLLVGVATTEQHKDEMLDQASNGIRQPTALERGGQWGIYA